MTTRDDQLSGWDEKLQSTSQNQVKLALKEGHGHCLVRHIHSGISRLRDPTGK